MMPALAWLETHARTIVRPTPAFFYWGSGILSSGLDNAPTYLSFLRMIYGALIPPEIVPQVQQLVQAPHSPDLAAASDAVHQTWLALEKYHAPLLAAKAVGGEQIETAYLLGHPLLSRYLLAISIGAVFFGATTYIGNGPNFMVKSIAVHQKVHAPGFLGYLFHYALPYLGPVLLIIWWIFFRLQG
jgi:Na+/H+ antiporter NhaD/arsenite permease-like protein